MRRVTQVISAAGNTAPVILDQYLTPTDVILAVQFGGSTGGTANVQYTPDPIYNSDGYLNTSATYFNHPVLAALTTDGVDQLDVPASAVRLNVTGTPTTPITFQVGQAGIR
jgi:hypothetical protein